MAVDFQALSAQQRGQLFRRDADEERDFVGWWLRVEQAIEAHLDALARELDQMRRDNRRVDFAAVTGLERYGALLATLDRAAGQFQRNAATRITTEQQAYALAGLLHAQDSIRAQTAQRFTTISPADLTGFVGQAGDGTAIDALIGGGTLYAVDGLTTALIGARGPEAAVAAGRRGLAQGLQHALTVAATEQWRVYRAAKRDQFQASNRVAGWRRMARRTPNTCAGCLAADGWVYYNRDEFEGHPNCRCDLIPILPGEAMPDWEPVEDWFRRQDAATQKSILGAGRLDAYQRGADLRGFATIRHSERWGDSIQPVPVRDIVGVTPTP